MVSDVNLSLLGADFLANYPLANIADVTSFLHGAKILSKLDLLKG